MDSNRNGNLQDSKAPLKNQAKGTSLFTSAASNQMGSREHGRPVVRYVMHKCIMVKLVGNEKHVKYANKHVNFPKSEGNF